MPDLNFSVPLDANGRPVIIMASDPVVTAVSVNGTATKLPTDQKVGRTSILLYNNGAETVYIGPADVTTSNGFLLKMGETLGITITDKVDLYGITAATTEEVRVLEG